ncbi:MAG TPA: neprosin family prolyl endopeptidase [Polyangiaceae bacterium]|nr:neprosin family prolyl endopeptidase [Polyangiaceae bacterium]
MSMPRWPGCAIALVTVTGCSSASRPGEPAPAGSRAESTAAVDEAVQDARIQKYIDSIYLRENVRYSFLTKFHESIDCVDSAAIPGQNAMPSEAVPQSLPSSAPQATETAVQGATERMASEELQELMINTGRPDANGQPRKCPSGTVPMLRTMPERIKAVGGLDAYLGAVREKQMPPVNASRFRTPDVADRTGYRHAVAGWFNNTPNQGGAAWMSIFDPTTALYGHSLAEVWVIDSTYTQTVEVGWDVDNGIWGDSNPHVFIYSTVDNYMTTGCFNNVADPTSGLKCTQWWTNPNTPFVLGQTLPYGTVGGSQVEIEFAAVNFNGSGGIPANWWVYAQWAPPAQNPPPLGAYVSNPLQGLSGPTFTGTMKTQASTLQMGGEVSDPAQMFQGQMGSGQCPPKGQNGYGVAAYAYNGGYWNPSFSYITSNFNEEITGTQCRPLYSLELLSRGTPSWNEMWFYYGGPGYPYSCPCD